MLTLDMALQATTEDLLARYAGDGAGIQGGDGGEHLEGGAGRVQAHSGPVVQGVALVGLELAVVLPEGGQVVGGVGGRSTGGPSGTTIRSSATP